MVIPRSLASCLALLSLLGTAIAAPSPTADPYHDKTVDLAPRACQTLYPEVFYWLDKTYPNITIEANSFSVMRRKGVNTRVAGIVFVGITVGSTGCMLGYDSPSPGFPGEYGEGPSVTVDIWSTHPWTEPYSPTYSRQPLKNQKVSSINIPTQVDQDPFHTILASGTCSYNMTFLAEYSPWQQGDGTALWDNKPDIFSPLEGLIDESGLDGVV
ncbi:hypothetical protein ACJ73_01178 [Blastomyces percursus]|uniref:Ubiquitin 3 binding protein But2 C-terminal domain-containing protein n=1 Tax=Blastomyces percursus TaxID=1658174 RepID=A0A1J9RIH7_9EURO|nr:hypothetical protein ACJ73_01178 [Blastomyces percursus]